MLEAEVRPMTDSEFTFMRPQPGRSFRRSFSALPGQGHDKEQVSLISAVHLEKENPILQSMCKLLTSLLRLPAAGAGMMSRGSLEYTGFQKPAGWSAPSLAALPVTQELLVVPDLQKDHRFADTSKMGPARFYVAAPLTASNGKQIGALHCMDEKPRPGGLSGEEKRIFMDMVRIMSHKVEEDYSKRQEHEQSERTKDKLLQALDKIRSPICVCEISQTSTKILFANHTWTTLAGVGVDPLVNVSMWDILKAADEPQEEAQARFWACEVGKQDFAANFVLSLDHQDFFMRLHFRSANRGAPKAVKETRGLLNQAVSRALEPSFFFAMFEQDVEDFVQGTGKTPNGAASNASGQGSHQMSRAGSRCLDDDLLEATGMAAGLAVKERPSGVVSPSLQEPPGGTSSTPTLRDPGLTIEDSAQLQPSEVPLSATARAEKQERGGTPAQSTRKAKQPSCGCVIC